MTKSLYDQELLDSISQRIQDYGIIPHKGIIGDNLTNILHTSMRSETSDDIADDGQEAQPCESAKPVIEDMLSKVEGLLRELKKKDKMATID
ncbi:hypothetical protein H5410_003479 [Solanum commersonii]|uniref:Uncharacterized protein n=1 Tax=Solanum commersonii TaxID=4109 RepID=A0A9J6B580_SOLCO|nr:hypothetical protein H5410_003479 [Solanum commersonii]